MKNFFMAIVLAFVSVAAFAGDYDVSGIDRTRMETLSEGRADIGVVVSVQEVDIESSTAAKIGSAAFGTIAGGAVGSKMGKGNGRIVAGTLMGMLGAAGASYAGEKIFSAKGQEVIVKKQSGGLIVVTQADTNLYVGQSVFVVKTQGKTRVSPMPDLPESM